MFTGEPGVLSCQQKPLSMRQSCRFVCSLITTKALPSRYLQFFWLTLPEAPILIQLQPKGWKIAKGNCRYYFYGADAAILQIFIPPLLII